MRVSIENVHMDAIEQEFHLNLSPEHRQMLREALDYYLVALEKKKEFQTRVANWNGVVRKASRLIKFADAILQDVRALTSPFAVADGAKSVAGTKPSARNSIATTSNKRGRKPNEPLHRLLFVLEAIYQSSGGESTAVCKWNDERDSPFCRFCQRLLAHVPEAALPRSLARRWEEVRKRRAKYPVPSIEDPKFAAWVLCSPQ